MSIKKSSSRVKTSSKNIATKSCRPHDTSVDYSFETIHRKIISNIPLTKEEQAFYLISSKIALLSILRVVRKWTTKPTP